MDSITPFPPFGQAFISYATDPTIPFPPPPRRHDWPWFCNRITTLWKRLDTRAKWILPLIGLLLGISLFNHSTKFLGGQFFYWSEYIKALWGHDMLTESCAAIMKESNPWWELRRQDYFRYYRCWGNEDGWSRQGTFPGVGDVVELVMHPFGMPVLPTVVFLMFFFYVAFPWLWDKSLGFVMSLWDTVLSIYFAPRPVTTPPRSPNTPRTPLFGSEAVPPHIPADAPAEVPTPSWYERNTRLAWDIGIFIGSTILSAFTHYAVTVVVSIVLILAHFWLSYLDPRTPKDCYHIELPHCQCYDAYESQIDMELKRIDKLELQLSSLNKALQTAEHKRDEAISDLRAANNYSWSRLSSSSPTTLAYALPYKKLQAEFDRATRRVGELEQDKDDLIAEQQSMFSHYEKRIAKLQAQVNYSIGAGEDMAAAQKEVDQLKSDNRRLQRENQALALTGMQVRQALAKEREVHSEKCQDEAGCQRRIAELEYKCKRLLEAHAYHDKLVVDAAEKFGMPKEEAQHVTLLSYLAQVTLEVTRLRALGIYGVDDARNTVDIQVKNLELQLNEKTKLTDRLEREVDRLGGDVVGIRAGLDTTRPKDWTVDLNMTYEHNAWRIFPLYQCLHETVGLLTRVFHTAGVEPPVWEPEKPRNDESWVNRVGYEHTPEQLQDSNALINPMAPNSDVLTHKLTINEVQRLYNRGLQLSIEIRRLAEKKERVEPGTVDLSLVPLLANADRIFKDVLHEVLDDIRPLTQSPTEQSPDPRREKKFEIYTAMQQSIAALTYSILSNARSPPLWVASFEQSTKLWTSPDNLALNLINVEMRTLEIRIKQLLDYMTQYRLPGTISGPPLQHIQNDPQYVERWYQLVSAATFARLTLEHWKLHLDQKEVQVTDEHGHVMTVLHPQATLLPLKIDKFMKTVLGVGESVEEKRRREIKEGLWPEKLEPVLVMDPIVGPKLEFRLGDLSAPSQNTSSPNHNTTHHNNTANPKESKDPPYDAARKLWEQKRQRIEQLKNHINAWGIRDNFPLPNVSAPLRKNADMAFVRAANEHFDALINGLVAHIGAKSRKGGGRYEVPKMVGKGGKMFP